MGICVNGVKQVHCLKGAIKRVATQLHVQFQNEGRAFNCQYCNAAAAASRLAFPSAS